MEELKRLVEASYWGGGGDWLLRKLDLVLVDKAMLSKSLIQFFADGWGCVPFL